MGTRPQKSKVKLPFSIQVGRSNCPVEISYSRLDFPSFYAQVCDSFFSFIMWIIQFRGGDLPNS